MNVVEEIRKFVEKECKKDSAKYGMEAYNHHFVPTVRYAKLITEKIGGDKEVIEISAWLHDIGSIMVGRENHHIDGQEIAEKKLRELSYDEDKIKKVKECIFSHRGSQGIKPKTKEAQIIADADGMGTFDKLHGLFYAAFVAEKLDTEQARKSVKQKLINSYNKISFEAKRIVKNKYDAAMLLLKDAD